MHDQITLLGVKGGPSVRQRGAMPTSILLTMAGQTILIDCGIGATRSAVEAGLSLPEIGAIFITHLHSDHLLELGPLIYTAWTTGLCRPITVFGPEGIGAYWDGFLASMAYDRAIRIADEGRPELLDLVRLSKIDEGFRESLNGLMVSALRVDHPPVTDCFALRFESSHASVVFSSDTAYFPPLADFARGADVLVHEAMLPAGVESIVRRTPGATRLRQHLQASHTTAADAGRIASMAGVGHLVLNHLVPADDPAFTDADWFGEVATTWTGPTTVGRDGMIIPVG
ncbi:MAG: MBL fold metallo-hydrolase [Paracoccaceae bacterium]|nr:MBL fold metallo-hydrolase [Paracoccaceae bacterium]